MTENDESPNHRRHPTESVVSFVEQIAAVLLGAATLIVFISAVGRYLFTMPIPDAFDLSRLVLAVAIIWGFASLGFRGSHIKVDILALAVKPRTRRILDLLAWSALLVFTLLIFWKISGRVMSQIGRGETTMELRLPHWPFLVAIAIGLLMAAVTTLIRLWRVFAHGETLDAHEAIPDEDELGGDNLG